MASSGLFWNEVPDPLDPIELRIVILICLTVGSMNVCTKCHGYASKMFETFLQTTDFMEDLSSRG